MIGSELLQNYLRIINEPVQEKQLRDTTLGTIFHIGMAEIAKNFYERVVYTEYSMNTKLSNGWVVSGTADLIVHFENYIEIHDYKLAKKYTAKMVKQDIKMGKEHSYALQLQTLHYLWNRKNSKYLDNKLFIDFFLKDTKIQDQEKVLEQVEIEPKANEDMEEILLQKTNELQSYIEEGKIPPKCTYTWPRSVKGRLVQFKCAYYCSQSEVCPYYDSLGNNTMIDFANWEPS
jgi:hypothetical protein